MNDYIFKGIVVVALVVIAISTSVLAFKPAGKEANALSKLTENDLMTLQRGLCMANVFMTSDDILSEKKYSELSEYDLNARERRNKEAAKSCVDKYPVK